MIPEKFNVYIEEILDRPSNIFNLEKYTKAYSGLKEGWLNLGSYKTTTAIGKEIASQLTYSGTNLDSLIKTIPDVTNLKPNCKVLNYGLIFYDNYSSLIRPFSREEMIELNDSINQQKEYATKLNDLINKLKDKNDFIDSKYLKRILFENPELLQF